MKVCVCVCVHLLIVSLCGTHHLGHKWIEFWSFCSVLALHYLCVNVYVPASVYLSLHHWCPPSECVCVVLYALSLLCASNPQVPGAPGEQLKQGQRWLVSPGLPLLLSLSLLPIWSCSAGSPGAC